MNNNKTPDLNSLKHKNYSLKTNSAFMKFMFDIRTWLLGLRKIYAFSMVLFVGFYLELHDELTHTMAGFLITVLGTYSGFNTFSKKHNKDYEINTTQ